MEDEVGAVEAGGLEALAAAPVEAGVAAEALAVEEVLEDSAAAVREGEARVETGENCQNCSFGCASSPRGQAPLPELP